MRHNYKFNRRILDKESDPRYIERGKLIDATNCRVSDSGNIENLEGTIELNASVLPSGHLCIGAKKYGDWIYYFSTNNTTHNIGRYNVETDVNQSVNLSNADLNFNTSNRIDFIDFLDDTENNKFFMFWTDGVNPPRYYDWNNPPAFTFDENYFSVIKAPPFRESDIFLFNNVNISTSNIAFTVYTVAHRYIYYSGNISSLSFRSISLIYPGLYGGSRFNSALINIDISSDFYEDIDFIEVYAIDENSSIAYLIDSIKVELPTLMYQTIFSDKDAYPILSQNDFIKLYDNVPLKCNIQSMSENRIFYANYIDGYDNDITVDWNVEIDNGNTYFESLRQPTSNTPSEQIYNFSVFNYTIGSDNDVIIHTRYRFRFEVEEIVTGDRYKDIIIEFTVGKSYETIGDLFNDVNNNIATNFLDHGISVDVRTSEVGFTLVDTDFQFIDSSVFRVELYESLCLKHGETYDYALQYYDIYNRVGAMFLKKDIKSPTLGELVEPIRMATVEINHQPPSWAVKFKILRREKKYNFIRFEPESVEVLFGNDIYLKIADSYNVFISDDARNIEVIVNDTLTVAEVYFNVPIIRIEVTDSSSSIGAGRWIVIGNTGQPGYTVADVIGGTSDFVGSTFLVYNIPTQEDVAFKEIPHFFSIVDQYHIIDYLDPNFGVTGGDRSQTASQSFRRTLTLDFDVDISAQNDVRYQYGESDITSLGRSIPESKISQLQRKYSITYSEIYNYETGFNGLSSFNTALINFKDFPREYGPIKSLYYRDTDIVVFQEDKVIRQPYNKNIVESIGGGQALTSGGQVLGTFAAYAGEYGMSNPESLSFRDSALFWVDTKRGVVMRLSQDGLYPISKLGVREVFRDLLIGLRNSGSRITGHYDWFKDEYGVYFPGSGVWYFNPDAQGWINKIEFTLDMPVNDGLNVYSFFGNKVYKHNEIQSDQYNIFHDTNLGFSFEFALNEAFSDIKTLHALWIEGDDADFIITNPEGNIARVSKVNLENKEDSLYGFVQMNETKSDYTNLIGLGIISSTSGTVPNITLSFANDFRTPQVGEVIKGHPSGHEGVFVSRTGNDILLSGATGDFTGDFVFNEKSAAVSGDNIRGLYFILKGFYTPTSEKKKYFAINIEASKSNV